MNSNRKYAVVVAALATVFAQSHTSAAEPSQETLRSRAKVSEAQATATALARVPQGTVKSAELEMENGKLVWSFDVAPPRGTGVTEIQVDAITGKIASQKQESPAEEAAEAKAQAREAGAVK